MSVKWLKESVVGLVWTLAFVVLLFNAGMAYLNFRDIVDNYDKVSQRFEVLLQLKNVLASMQDAETGLRGFVITQDEKYLQPYQTGLSRVRDQLASLDQAPLLFEDYSGHLRDLRRSVDAKLSELDQILQMQRSQGPEAARLRMKTDRSIQYMDSVRAVVEAMEHQMRLKVQEQTLLSRESHVRAVWLLITGSVVVLGVSLAVLLLVQRQLKSRHALEQQLRQTNEELEQRVQHRTEALRATNESLREENLERKRLEEQAQTFAEELQRSNRDLEQFAAVASHDLQEPLRKILAFSDRLSIRHADQLDQTGKEYLDRIQTSAQRMRRLIEDLLAYSRLSRGKPFVTVDLNEIAGEVINDLDDRLEKTGGVVEVGELPELEADPLQMRQLFQNLIGNALKFHRPDTPPRVTISGRTLLRRRGETPGEIELTVTDNGIGFENEYAERIFQLFQRLHGRAEYDGSGMGLSICRKIVDRHRGTITARGDPGRGATFTIVLPIFQNARTGEEQPCLAQPSPSPS